MGRLEGWTRWRGMWALSLGSVAPVLQLVRDNIEHTGLHHQLMNGFALAVNVSARVHPGATERENGLAAFTAWIVVRDNQQDDDGNEWHQECGHHTGVDYGFVGHSFTLSVAGL